jgi:IS30 family transposase
MSQLTEHELYSIEDKIKEGYKDTQIATYIQRNKSIISRLFQKYQRDIFSASLVISDRLKTKSNNTQQHSRIEP